MLNFSKANMKLAVLAKQLGLKNTQLLSFDLPGGWSCPMADICKTKADRETGKLHRFGPVLCYAAKAEALYQNCRNMRWNNYDLLRACKNDSSKMVALVEKSLPKITKVVRIHSSGDFYNPAYFTAWNTIAINHPEIVFFGYTKGMVYVKADKPDNFSLIYSFGGRDDKYWNDTIPTCFIEVFKGQYPDIEQVCGTHENAYQDYSYIISGKSFKLAVH